MGSDILVNRLTVAFGAGSDAAAVKNVTTRFFSGQVTGLIGESGSGKSVLGMSILRLLPSSARLSGAIEFDGENLLSFSAREMQALRGSRIGLIPQSPGDSLDKVLRIRVQLEEALLAHSGQGRKEARRRAVELLKAFHFEDINRVMQSYPFSSAAVCSSASSRRWGFPAARNGSSPTNLQKGLTRCCVSRCTACLTILRKIISKA